jgi:hypothetical protein
MKKSILILLITVFTYSCDSTQQAKSTPIPIGQEISDEDGSKMPLYGGSMSNVEVWENYIAAHNARDFEAIRDMNAKENFIVNGPRGEVIKGSEAQAEFLTQWFTDNSPKWEINYLIANEYTDEKGQLQQWVTTGNDLTLNVEGNEVKVHQVSDVLIVNGKVQMFYVYERAAPAVE